MRLHTSSPSMPGQHDVEHHQVHGLALDDVERLVAPAGPVTEKPASRSAYSTMVRIDASSSTTRMWSDTAHLRPFGPMVAGPRDTGARLPPEP